MDTYLLIILAVTCLFSYQGFRDQTFFRKYEFHIGSIRAGEQFRMLTSAFLHGDFLHLVYNMYALYLFGPIIVVYMGGIGFLIVYLVSLLAGSLLTYFMHKNDFGYRAIGASGAVTGVVYAAILLNPNIEIWFLPGYIFGIGYLLYSIYGMKAKNDNIGHTAHFGGAIGGYIYTIVWDITIIESNLQTVVVLAIPIIILFFLSKTGRL